MIKIKLAPPALPLYDNTKLDMFGNVIVVEKKPKPTPKKVVVKRDNGNHSRLNALTHSWSSASKYGQRLPMQPLAVRLSHIAGSTCVACGKLLSEVDMYRRGYASGIELGLCGGCASYVAKEFYKADDGEGTAVGEVDYEFEKDYDSTRDFGIEADYEAAAFDPYY